jgi:hypothetical protein
MSTQELEQAVQELVPDEFASFASWFEEYLADRRDEELGRDIAAGRLAGLVSKAKADFQEGRCSPL